MFSNNINYVTILSNDEFETFTLDCNQLLQLHHNISSHHSLFFFLPTKNWSRFQHLPPPFPDIWKGKVIWRRFPGNTCRVLGHHTATGSSITLATLMRCDRVQLVHSHGQLNKQQGGSLSSMNEKSPSRQQQQKDASRFLQRHKNCAKTRWSWRWRVNKIGVTIGLEKFKTNSSFQFDYKVYISTLFITFDLFWIHSWHFNWHRKLKYKSPFLFLLVARIPFRKKVTAYYSLYEKWQTDRLGPALCQICFNHRILQADCTPISSPRQRSPHAVI